MLSTTLSLVFISIILFVALMPYFIKFWKSFGPPEPTALVGEQKEMGYVDLDDSQEDVRFFFSSYKFR